MISINYLQPYFYHFSEDSLALARLALSAVVKDKALKVLDLGAGAGVIGLEFALHCHSQVELTLCEKQGEYLQVLLSNCEELKAYKNDFISHVLIEDWSNLNLDQNFDLILCNPPYFLEHEGRPSKNENENRARRWSAKEEEEFYRLLLRLSQSHTKIALTLRKEPPFFFEQRMKRVEEQVFHARAAILTKGIVFALDIEADKGFS